jgi:hypothetical protein
MHGARDVTVAACVANAQVEVPLCPTTTAARHGQIMRNRRLLASDPHEPAPMTAVRGDTLAKQTVRGKVRGLVH